MQDEKERSIGPQGPFEVRGWRKARIKLIADSSQLKGKAKGSWTTRGDKRTWREGRELNTQAVAGFRN